MSGLQSEIPLTSEHASLDGRIVSVTGELYSLQIGRDGWTAGTVIRREDGAHVRFVGHDVSQLEVGRSVRLKGIWEVHPEFGVQLKVRAAESSLPREADAVARYLHANVHGCGPARASKIVAKFGPGCLHRLSRDPDCVSEVFPGALGVELAEAIREWAAEARQSRHAWQLTLRLLEHGLTLHEIRLIKRYFREADAAAVAAREHPYRLLQVPGVGWKTVDQIGRKLGTPEDDPERLAAALSHQLEKAARRGHSGLPRSTLVGRTIQLLGSDRPDLVQEVLDQLLDDCVMVEEAGVVTPLEISHLERSLARKIADLRWTRRCLDPTSLKRVDDVLATANPPLSPKQSRAVIVALQSGISVLTGRPGSGKTTTLKAFAMCCDALGWRVTVAAPTGKAASRAATVMDLEASTIHRLLGGSPSSRHDGSLDADVLIVDETSMCDLEVTEWLFAAVDPGRTRVLLTGDSDQLPSVGHGQVLADILGSGRVTTVRLEKVFRQAMDSRIITNANRLLDRRPLDLSNSTKGDWRFTPVARAADARAAIVAVLENLKQRSASADEIQVMAPMRRGELGVDSLNRLLQGVLNPDGRMGPDIGGDVRVRVGDRIIVTRNIYELDDGPLFNGELGVVRDVDVGRRSVTLEVGDREVTLSGVYRKLLHLAWAVTVHRAQGSEYQHAVLAYHHEGHGPMLLPAVLYTAITRAKATFHLIGSSAAVERTRAAASRTKRHTSLAFHIQQTCR